jgi:hypothetical protein
MGTGLSKRAVQEALRLLAKRRLLSIERESITAIPVYEVLRPWRSAPTVGLKGRAGGSYDPWA